MMNSKKRTWMRVVFFLMPLFFLAGCATPIGTREVGIRRTYEEINVTAIKEDAYSDASADVLHRFFLAEAFKKDPHKTIEVLHEKACADDRRDLLYALSELSYLTASQIPKTSTSKRDQARSYYLASAIYAYLYLLGERGGAPPSPFDRRYRVACDLYNTAIAQSIKIRKNVEGFKEGPRQLPIGTIFLELNSTHFPYDLEIFENIIAADELSVYGLTVRNRSPGLGSPFVAVEKREEDAPTVRSVAGTLFFRVEGDITNLKSGACRGVVELYSSFEKQEVQVRGKTIPLEDDLTAQLAYSLNQPFFWSVGKLQFLTGEEIFKSGIYHLQPYSPAKIPVVFVHGTMSSPVWWAEMFNTLRSDPVLWDKYQFWFYLYDSNKPIVFSAVHLRESLLETVKEKDPEGDDWAIEQMVIVGHSQGGLLTKLMATETEDRIIQAVANKKLEELDVDKEERETLQRYLIYEPLPFVKRVVFISTPHRGSYLAGDWVRRLVKKIVTLPLDILQTTTKLASAATKMGLHEFEEEGKFRTSIDSMSPKNKGLLALAEMPIAPGIQGHSIIAIKGNDEPPEGDDGVVKYTSAHIDYVESEFLVRAGHSCQGHPLVIEEVRRILLEHNVDKKADKQE
jgi:pimeloyl-ACP methyl ester carboxylesterase